MDYYYEQYFNTNEGKKKRVRIVFNLQLECIVTRY